MNKPILAVVLLLVALGVEASEGPVGSVVYLEGSPVLVRSGDVMDDPVDFGTQVLNYDQISTAATDFAEVAIDASTGIDAVIRVHPASSFYFDISSLQEEQRGSV